MNRFRIIFLFCFAESSSRRTSETDPLGVHAIPAAAPTLSVRGVRQRQPNSRVDRQVAASPERVPVQGRGHFFQRGEHQDTQCGTGRH